MSVQTENKRFLVTGGAGFIGSELVRQLAERGADTIVVDNLINGKRENLQGIPENRYRLVVADIRDTGTMRDLMSGVDMIYHLACLGVRHSLHSPQENQEVNATATLGLVSLAREAKVKRFVYVSSSEVYGTAMKAPMTEEHPTFPMTIYGASKLAGECYVRAFWHTYNYPTTIVRPFNTYGARSHHEGDCGEVIPKFMLRCMVGRPMIVFGDGTQTRDFTYVTDTAAGILAVGLSDRTIGRTLNIGSGREVSINDLAQQIATVLNMENARVVYEARRPGDVMRLLADTTLARNVCGYEPRVSLTQGLRRLRDWYGTLHQSPEDLLREEVACNWVKTGTVNHG